MEGYDERQLVRGEKATILGLKSSEIVVLVMADFISDPDNLHFLTVTTALVNQCDHLGCTIQTQAKIMASSRRLNITPGSGSITSGYGFYEPSWILRRIYLGDISQIRSVPVEIQGGLHFIHAVFWNAFRGPTSTQWTW
jgi:hypothetical protein